MPINFSPSHRRDKRYLLILIGLTALLFGSTFLAYSITKNTLEHERLKIFNQTSDKIQQLVEERMFAHMVNLHALQAFWAANPKGVTKEQFSTYINSLNLLYQYPGISSVSFIRRVADKLITTYIEPLEGREVTLGYDHTTDPIRKTFFDRVRDTGKIAASDKITLITTNQPGFFLTAPLYTGGVIPQSIVERKDTLIGFLILAFRDTQIFKTIFGPINPFPDIDFVVYDGNIENPDHLLFDSEPDFTPVAFSNLKSLLQTKKYVTIGDNPWTIIITAKPSFSLTWAAEKLPLFVLTSGLACSGTLALLILFYYRQHLKKWH